MKLKSKLIGLGVVALAATSIQVAGATSASAHTPLYTLTCSAATVSLANYHLIDPTEAVTHQELVSPEVLAVDAVYKTVTDSPEVIGQPYIAPTYKTVTDHEAIPAVLAIPAVPAVTHEEYRLKTYEGWTNWSSTKPSVWWLYPEHKRETRTVIDHPAIPAVPGMPAIPAVTHQEIDNPGQPLIEHVDAVTHEELVTPAVEYQAAVYKTVTDHEATLGDDSPNHVTVTVDDQTLVDQSFGTSYDNSWPLEPSFDHTMHIVVTSADEIGSVDATVSTDSCVPPVTEITPQDPILIDATSCDVPYAQIELPSANNDLLYWDIDTIPSGPGILYAVSPGEHTVSVFPADGYTFPDGSNWISWTFTTNNFDTSKCGPIDVPKPKPPVVTPPVKKPVVHPVVKHVTPTPVPVTPVAQATSLASTGAAPMLGVLFALICLAYGAVLVVASRWRRDS